MSKIGWRFPPTNGGIVAGYNDPGIAHFGGAPLASLARETIQNSLDARLSSDEPVHVSFEEIQVEPNEIGRDELADAIDACINEPTNDDKVIDALNRAKSSVGSDTIPCLRVSDRNTTGLKGDQWRALVKMQGVSHKPDVLGAGGSHGIGKYAPFLFSDLRTVFYWTCYKDNGTPIEQFQGKSVLISHKSSEGETQGTGFYGYVDNCTELKGSEIPSRFRLPQKVDGSPVFGTSIVISGFNVAQDWRLLIASSVIENFFHAIQIGVLDVLLEPDESEPDTELFEINKNTLPDWFARLQSSADNDEDNGDDESSLIEQARSFWEVSTTSGTVEETQDPDLGHCRLWVRVADGLPSRVALVRQTGMLITTQQQGIIRFSGFREFAAVCVFEDPAGNELLRQMENPRHDQFEPDRLPEDERDRGRRALRRITKWIRDAIKKHAGPPEGGKRTVLSELATYLPDYQPSDHFEDTEENVEGVKEPGFGDRLTLTLKPIRRSLPTPIPIEEDVSQDNDEGDGEDTGVHGGGGTGTNTGEGGSGGSGEGDAVGGSGTRGGSKSSKSIPISNVRILAVEGTNNRYRVSFRAEADATVRLELTEAGDSSAIPRDDVCAAEDGVSLDQIQLRKNKSTAVEITADAPIGGRAWRVSAFSVDGD